MTAETFKVGDKFTLPVRKRRAFWQWLTRRPGDLTEQMFTVSEIVTVGAGGPDRIDCAKECDAHCINPRKCETMRLSGCTGPNDAFNLSRHIRRQEMARRGIGGGFTTDEIAAGLQRIGRIIRGEPEPFILTPELIDRMERGGRP